MTRLAEAFDQITPPEPPTTGWGAKARSRACRQRMATAGIGLAAVAALVVPLSLRLGGGEPVVLATPSPSATQSAPSSPAPLVPKACQPDGLQSTLTELPDRRMPEGPVRVWLCGGESATGFTYVGAAEPLTTRLDEAVAAFNSVPSEPGIADCPANLSIAFGVVYEYPDGSKQVVEGMLGGCEYVQSAMAHRGEPKRFLTDLRGLWQQQRAEQATTWSGQVDFCPERTTVMGTGFASMTSAWFCGPNGVAVELSAKLVAEIASELAALPDDLAGLQPGINLTAPSLVLMSPHGDPLSIQGTPDGFRWHDPEPLAIRYWQPTAELAGRMWAEIYSDGRCQAPARIVPADVKVKVFDGGGGAANVQRVTERLAKAGFKVTNTGQKRVAELGGAVVIHQAPANPGAALVGAQFERAGGAMSESDSVVDVVVTSHFDPATAFRKDPVLDLPAGPLTCSPTPGKPEPTISSGGRGDGLVPLPSVPAKDQ